MVSARSVFSSVVFPLAGFSCPRGATELGFARRRSRCIVSRLLVGVNARAQVNAREGEGERDWKGRKSRERDIYIYIYTRFKKRWNQFWRGRSAFSLAFTILRKCTRRSTRPWTSKLDLTLFVCLLLFVQERQRIGAHWKSPEAAFHGFFTNHSTRRTTAHKFVQARTLRRVDIRRDLN